MVVSKGKKGGLSVFVRSYDADVACIDDQPLNDDGQCSKLLDLLQVSSVPLLFARHSSKSPYPRTVIVPVGGKKIDDGEQLNQRPYAREHFPRRHGLINLK